MPCLWSTLARMRPPRPAPTIVIGCSKSRVPFCHSLSNRECLPFVCWSACKSFCIIHHFGRFLLHLQSSRQCCCAQIASMPSNQRFSAHCRAVGDFCPSHQECPLFVRLLPKKTGCLAPKILSPDSLSMPTNDSGLVWSEEMFAVVPESLLLFDATHQGLS